MVAVRHRRVGHRLVLFLSGLVYIFRWSCFLRGLWSVGRRVARPTSFGTAVVCCFALILLSLSLHHLQVVGEAGLALRGTGETGVWFRGDRQCENSRRRFVDAEEGSLMRRVHTYTGFYLFYLGFLQTRLRQMELQSLSRCCQARIKHTPNSCRSIWGRGARLRSRATWDEKKKRSQLSHT